LINKYLYGICGTNIGLTWIYNDLKKIWIQSSLSTGILHCLVNLNISCIFQLMTAFCFSFSGFIWFIGEKTHHNTAFTQTSI
jgi:hypothetical protein